MCVEALECFRLTGNVIDMNIMDVLYVYLVWL